MEPWKLLAEQSSSRRMEESQIFGLSWRAEMDKVCLWHGVAAEERQPGWLSQETLEQPSQLATRIVNPKGFLNSI